MSTSAPELTDLEQEFLDKVDKRLEKLKEQFAGPLAEYERLLASRQRMLGDSTGGNPVVTTTRSTTRSGGTTRARQGDRKEEVLGLIRSKPGITIPEIAAATGASANYLYRVRNKAIEDRLIRKDGQQLFPVAEGEPDPARVRELEAAAAK